MKTVRPALTLFALLSILLGFIYPLVTTGFAYLLFPNQAQGSIIYRDDKNAPPLGSKWIGQNFTDNRYFLGRLSATGTSPYNAAQSSGANLAPTNPALKTFVSERAALLSAQSNHPEWKIPVDLVTHSASGLDPEISLSGALYQVGRVAKARNLPEEIINKLIEEQTQKPFLGLGTARINVLLLNLTLDKLEKR